LDRKKAEEKVKKQQQDEQRAALMSAFKAKSRVSLMSDDFMHGLSGLAAETGPAPEE